MAAARFREELANLTQPMSYLQGQKFMEQQKRADRQGCHPLLLEFEAKLVSRMVTRHNVPMFAYEWMRSPERQAILKERGVSNAGPGESPHQYGMAFDLIHSVKAWALTKKQWLIIGHVGKELACSIGIKVRWGGDFRTIYEPAHWELEDWQKHIVPTQPPVEKIA